MKELTAQARPNPFQSSVTVQYRIPSDGLVEVAIYDAGGRRIRTLLSQRQPAGTHDVAWDGNTETGGRAASGLYFYRVMSSGRELARKIVLLK